MRDEETSLNLLITGVFWDVFNANNAVTALLHVGFADADINAVGVLSARHRISLVF